MTLAARAAMAVLAAGALLVVWAPAAGAAPRLTTPLACWSWDSPVIQTFPVVGTGFPPNVSMLVGIQGDLNYTEDTAHTDANGDLTGLVYRSSLWTGVPMIATVEALEPSKQQPQPPPRLLATMQVPAVYRTGTILYPYVFHHPVPTTWRARTIWGGYPGQTVYAHYYYESHPFSHPHPVRTVRLGTLTGPCGGLNVGFPILGGMRPRAGGWLVAVDRQRRPRLRNALVSPYLLFDVRRWNGLSPRPFRGARRGTWYLVNAG
jgi:hypothetical protein